MIRTAIRTALFLTAAAALMAQQPARPAAPAPDLAHALQNAYKQNSRFILASADKWPEDQYNWRPAGLESQLRTFGQILVHIANENNSQCSRSMGKASPKEVDDTKTDYSKAEATKIVKDSFDFCGPVFASLTNSNMAEMVKIPGRGERARATSLIMDVAHSNEQYGMIMVYYAMKGMVPVSHERN